MNLAAASCAVGRRIIPTGSSALWCLWKSAQGSAGQEDQQAQSVENHFVFGNLL